VTEGFPLYGQIVGVILTYSELRSALAAKKKSLQPVNVTENFSVCFKPTLISLSSQNVNLKCGLF
jgi:hypothetical protein